ncbi:MAG: hypothetical protein PHF56_15705 [Desulfuromonadaceae bacterium]|nr:hypothetical protein [Desulfuromonadaceae bacterium]
MTQNEAVSVAKATGANLGVPKEFELSTAEKRIIELVSGSTPLQDDAVGPVFDRIAWLVTFTEGHSWVEISIDDENQRMIRFRKSRGVILEPERG